MKVAERFFNKKIPINTHVLVSDFVGRQVIYLHQQLPPIAARGIEIIPIFTHMFFNPFIVIIPT
jgi:hypothetical protein